MAAKVVVVVPAPSDILTGYSAGALARIQSATSESGVFANLTTTAIVADQYVYEVWDTAGSATTWYRWRPEKSDGSVTGDWSPAFQGLEAAAVARTSGAYASIDDYLLTISTIPADTRRLAAIERALATTREELDAEIRRSAFRWPQTGTETWIVHGNGTGYLHVHEGLVSVSLIEVRLSTNGTWESLDADDWWLEGELPGEVSVPSGESYFHIRLSDEATYTAFPHGEQRVRITGARGYTRPPLRWVQANIALARQRIAGDVSFGGAQAGPPDMGSPTVPQRLPDAVWRLKVAESRRFMTCST
jgi:hypothetical protein